jgi:hypothetical protein
MMQELKAERVRVIVGWAQEPDSRMVPVVVHDMESRRLKYQHAYRDELAVMNGDPMGEWMAYWLPTAERWALIDYVSDMRKALKVVGAA